MKNDCVSDTDVITRDNQDLKAGGVKYDAGKEMMDLIGPQTVGRWLKEVRPGCDSEFEKCICLAIEAAFAYMAGGKEDLLAAAFAACLTAFEFDEHVKVENNDLSIFLPNGMLALGDLYTKGATKYAPRNWEQGMPVGRLLAAGLRHLFKRCRGEKRDDDPVAGTFHLIHAAWCFNTAYDLVVCNKTQDDRTKLRKATSNDA